MANKKAQKHRFNFKFKNIIKLLFNVEIGEFIFRIVIVVFETFQARVVSD